MADSADRLKKAYADGSFGEEFIKVAKEDLPFIFGRLALLEEFHSLNAPGYGERSGIVSRQLRDHPFQAAPRVSGLRRWWMGLVGL